MSVLLPCEVTQASPQYISDQGCGATSSDLATADEQLPALIAAGNSAAQFAYRALDPNVGL